MDGREEPDDAGVLPPRQGVDPTADWAAVPAQGPRRKRPLVPVREERELDPHDDGVAKGVGRNRPMTGAVLTLCPQWRRKPCYRTFLAGAAEIVMAEDAARESRMWAQAFAADARLLFVRSHIHKCMSTCYKHRGGGEAGDLVRVCRFNFNHEFEVVVFGRMPPRRMCKNERCVLRLHETPVHGDDGAEVRKVHPYLCPASAMRGKVPKFLRRGKA